VEMGVLCAGVESGAIEWSMVAADRRPAARRNLGTPPTRVPS
jgi:hypothetical protein